MSTTTSRKDRKRKARDRARACRHPEMQNYKAPWPLSTTSRLLVQERVCKECGIHDRITIDPDLKEPEGEE